MIDGVKGRLLMVMRQMCSGRALELRTQSQLLVSVTLTFQVRKGIADAESGTHKMTRLSNLSMCTRVFQVLNH